MIIDQAASLLSPSSADDAAAIIARAAGRERSLDIVGGATRSGLGRPLSARERISSEKLSGVTLYEPSELVISAKTGTPVAEIEATLDKHGQMLAFEPMDHRRIYGTSGEPTIGGVAATNASGPRRIKVGAARDALLGAKFVNGRGELIKAGGRVMKNVTGLDLAKVVCGSHGTLGFLTEVTFKVLPKPERIATLEIVGLDDQDGVDVLSKALGSPYEPSAAAHLPAGVSGEKARTLIRLEGFSDSVAHRLEALGERLSNFGAVSASDDEDTGLLWRDVRDAAFLAEPADRAIWRISTVPGEAASLVATIGRGLSEAKWYYDWGGGLVWISVPLTDDAGAAIVRSAVASGGGHATLVRAPDAVRGHVLPFQPLSAAEGSLTAGIKRSLDPDGVFGPGRMYQEL